MQTKLILSSCLAHVIICSADRDEDAGEAIVHLHDIYGPLDLSTWLRSLDTMWVASRSTALVLGLDELVFLLDHVAVLDHVAAATSPGYTDIECRSFEVQMRTSWSKGGERASHH